MLRACVSALFNFLLGPLGNVSTPRHLSNVDTANPFEQDNENNIKIENSKIICGTFGKVVEKITDDKFGGTQNIIKIFGHYLQTLRLSYVRRVSQHLPIFY